MERLLAYSVLFANIVAIILVTLVQPQTAALYRKKIYDTRAYLLAQECTMGSMSCDSYMAMMCTMANGTWTPGTGGGFGTCTYANNSSCSGASCFNQEMCNQYATMYPSYGYSWNGSACVVISQQAGSSGISSLTLVSGGLYTTPAQSQNVCLAELGYMEAEKGVTERKPSALGTLIKAGGMPQSVTTILQDICFMILPSITEGKNGSQAFTDGSAKKALAESLYHGLNNAPHPLPSESILEWTERVGIPYLRELKSLFGALQNVGMSNPYLINPMPYITDTRKNIDSIIASFSPQEKQLNEKKEEIVELKLVETTDDKPVVIQTIPEQLPAPMQKVVAEEPKGIIQRLIAIVRKKLGLDAVRESGVKTRTMRIDAEKRNANKERMQGIIREFETTRMKYCETHACKKNP